MRRCGRASLAAASLALAAIAAGAAAAEREGMAGAPAKSAPAARAARELPLDCEHCPPLVRIPAGTFRMGSTDGEKGRDEGPVREVRLARDFAMGKYEVTLGQYRRFVEASGHRPVTGCRVHRAAVAAGEKAEWVDDPTKSWSDPGFHGGPPSDDQPVVCVGRPDAIAYVEWLAKSTGKPYRLPSEAEWEYAARAGSSGIYWWGNNEDNACTRANLYDRTGRKSFDFGWGFANCEDGWAELAPVGRLEPNAFGLYDVLGNAWEWLADCYREGYAGASADGRATPDAPDCKLYAVRGGGWMTRPSRNRLTFRGRDPNDIRYNYFGFRVARDL